MKNIFITLSMLLCGLLISNAQNNTAAGQLGWTLSVHSVSFGSNTLEEALDSIKIIGLDKVDAYRGKQDVGIGIETLHYWLDKKELNKVKKLIKEKGLELNHFGVIQGENEEEWRKIFEFAKYMGVKMLISEPEYKHLKYVDQLAQEYGIRVGIHNHPAPTRYWHPNTVITYIKKLKLSNHVGIYPDVVNWVRSGLEPLEMLKLAEGHVIGIQIKDLGKGMVPWGTGKVNVPGILRELKRQNFKGNISFEYFGKFSKVEYIKKSVEYFHYVTNQLLIK